MGFDMGSVDHQPLKVRVVDDDLKQLLPHALVAPSTESAMGIFPVAIHRRQVAPRGSCAQYPYDGVNEPTIVFCGTAPVMELPGQMRGDELPCAIIYIVTMKGVIHSILRLGGQPLPNILRIPRFNGTLKYLL